VAEPPPPGQVAAFPVELARNYAARHSPVPGGKPGMRLNKPSTIAMNWCSDGVRGPRCPVKMSDSVLTLTYVRGCLMGAESALPLADLRQVSQAWIADRDPENLRLVDQVVEI